MEDFTLNEFVDSCKGIFFGTLVLYHIDRNRKSIFTANSRLKNKFIKDLNHSIHSLPKEIKPIIEGFIDKWNSSIKNRSYWLSDCAEIVIRIVDDAKNTLKKNKVPYNDDTLFEMLNIIILNYAYNAVYEKKMEKLIRDCLYNKIPLKDFKI